MLNVLADTRSTQWKQVETEDMRAVGADSLFLLLSVAVWC